MKVENENMDELTNSLMRHQFLVDYEKSIENELKDELTKYLMRHQFLINSPAAAAALLELCAAVFPSLVSSF